MSDNSSPDAIVDDIEQTDKLANESPDHCKICRDEETDEEPLFTPCRCIGSIGKIHEQCLYNWIIQKLNINDIDSYIRKDPKSGRLVLLKNIDVKCDICRSPYTFKTLYKSENIKDLSWAQFLGPLWKKLRSAATFGLLIFLVGLIVFVVVPNYWILLRLFLEKIVNSFFRVDNFKNGLDLKEMEHSDQDFSLGNTWKAIGNTVVLNSYKGLVDILFVGLVALSIYFSQDLINSEYIFKEMLLQKMGHVDVIDLKKTTVPYTYQVQIKCLQLLKGQVSIAYDTFNQKFLTFAPSLQMQMSETDVEAFILKTVKESSSEISEKMAKILYYIPKDLPTTFVKELEESILQKISTRAQATNLMDLFKGSSFFDKLSTNFRSNQNEDPEPQSDEEPWNQVQPNVIFEGSEDDSNDEEYNPNMHESSSEEEEDSDDDDGNRFNAQVDQLLDDIREDVNGDIFANEGPGVNEQIIINDDEGGFNMLTIRFSFKNLPKYCLIGCAVASVVLFLGFAIPYFLGRIVLTLMRLSLQFFKLFAVQFHIKKFSLDVFVDVLLKILDYENHPTFRRVIPCCLFFILVSLFIIAYVYALEIPPKPYKNMPIKDRSLYKNLFHIKQLFKTYIIISIELLVFPIMSGMMIDISFIAPLVLNQSKNDSMKFFAIYEVLGFLPSFVQVIAHAAMGTIYMLSMASFIGMIRSKILRNGVLYFVRSPEDPNRKILRDCLATSFRLQFRKLAQSMFVYMAFIFGGFGITTRVVLPTIYDSFNKTKPLVACFVLEKKITLIKLIIFAGCLNLCYLSFYANKQKASEALEAIWRRFFKISCKRLRLSHYILNDSNIDERGIIVYRNSYYKFLKSKDAQFSNLDLYTEPKTLSQCWQLFKENPDVHCYFVPNGNFYRVPGSDILSTKFIRTLFVVVTKTDKVIHSKEIRSKMGYRGEFDNLIKESENFDKYDVIYCPPNFFRRSIALLVEVNVFAIFFIVAGVIFSNFIGQFIMYNLGQIFFGDDVLEEFNKDGVYFEFVCLGFAILLDTIYRVSKTIEVTQDAITSLRETRYRGVRLFVFLVLKYLIMTFISILVIQPINYGIYLTFGDWKNNFAKDNLIKASVVWFALNLFSMLRPHIISYKSDGEVDTVTSFFSINDEHGPLMNISLPSICYKFVAFYSPEGFLPEIIALLSNLNIKVFVKMCMHLKDVFTKAVKTKFSTILIGVILFAFCVFRLTKYVSKLRRNYENEILFEARILQNAEQ